MTDAAERQYVVVEYSDDVVGDVVGPMTQEQAKKKAASLQNDDRHSDFVVRELSPKHWSET